MSLHPPGRVVQERCPLKRSTCVKVGIYFKRVVFQSGVYFRTDLDVPTMFPCDMFTKSLAVVACIKVGTRALGYRSHEHDVGHVAAI